jgi:DNA-binding winged helix-turn-helix (wHTH) protein/Flp pilus assembly protein TadD
MMRDVIRLGSFALDLNSHELSRAGRPIHLPAQSARLLALLAGRAPEIVSRDEIRAALWGATHVEFDAAVHACISQIRSALGDNARAPRFIETIPRVGYRCLIDGRSDVRSDVPSDTRSEARSDTRSVPWALAAMLIAMIGALVWSAGAASRGTGSASLAATQKYERGISGLADASPAELLARVGYFESAIAADANFAEAYAGLADARLMLGAYRVEPPQIAYAAAKAAAQKALTLDPGLADAHAAFGAAVLHFEWDWTLARQHLRQAIALDPRSARAHLWWSRYLTAAGEHRPAILAARRAAALSPGSPSALTQVGIAQYYAGRAAEAKTACAEAAAMMREFVPAHACVEAATAASGTPNLLLVPAINLVRSGDRERAIAWLQRAANRRSDSLLLAGVEPGFDPLRGDPRFGAVLRRVGSPVPSR